MSKAFKNIKLQEKYMLFLLETQNAKEIESKTGKYLVMKNLDSKGDLFWFLGKSGAVRINRKNASTTSIDFSKQIQPKFLKWCMEKENV